DTFVSRRGLNILFQHEGIKVQFLFAPGAHNLVNKVLGDASGVVRLIQQVSTEKVVRSVGQLIQIKLITDVLCRWSRSTSAATTGGRSTPGTSEPRNLRRVPPTSVANQQLVGLRTLAKLPGIFGCDIPLTEPLVGNQSLVPEDILVGVLPECVVIGFKDLLKEERVLAHLLSSCLHLRNDLRVDCLHKRCTGHTTS